MVSVENLYLFFYNREVVGDAVFLISCHHMFKTLKYKVEKEREGEFEGEYMILRVYSLRYSLVCIVCYLTWFNIAVSDLLKQT